jgi:hypothetical protein
MRVPPRSGIGMAEAHTSSRCDDACPTMTDPDLQARSFRAAVTHQETDYQPYHGQEAFAETPIAVTAPAEHYRRPARHWNQVELSRHWCISPRTLERWRWLKKGPAYLKIGGRIVYRLCDIEAYEAAQVRRTNADAQ